jgi:hypothetical protein
MEVTVEAIKDFSMRDPGCIQAKSNGVFVCVRAGTNCKRNELGMRPDTVACGV